MKDVCVYDDTYDLIMGPELYSSENTIIQDSFAMRLFCLLEDYAHNLKYNDPLNVFYNDEET